MSDTAAQTYGQQFASFYDRLFPRDRSVDAAVDRLAALQLADAQPPLEFGVGTGRVAIPLAERVGTVTGVDSSPEMLAELERSAGGRVRAIQGDMRDYRGTGGHGLVYCVLGSLSILLDRSEQREAVNTFAAAAAPGGAVVIETHNPTFVKALHGGRRTESWLVPYERADTALLSHVTLDEARGIWQLSHIFFDAGHARVASEVSLLITSVELDEIAREAGLEPEAHHATWDGDPPQDGAPMLISTYRRI
jgi:SAM-dependent methyltransferase